MVISEGMSQGSELKVAEALRRPLRRVEYDKLVEAGLLRDERVELLYGSIVQMSPIGAPHGGTVQRLNELLVLALHGRASVRIQSPFAASDASEPEPDVAVVPVGRYTTAHPSLAMLLIEVADSSLAVDRETKARLYAESSVPEYWVVNLVDRIIEVHTTIVRAVYTRVIPYQAGESVRLESFPDVSIAAAEVLP
jgi:Uma2 family endonuclease